MFLLSLKSLKGKMLLLIAAVVAAVIVTVIINTGNARVMASRTDSVIDFTAETDDDRLNFIAQLGYSVNDEPVSVNNILIPVDFDDVYTQYNELQLQSGFDLSHYMGCTVKKWTYKVTNYPDNEYVQITLLVYKNKVIGGDICSTELDGFMLPLFSE